MRRYRTHAKRPSNSAQLLRLLERTGLVDADQLPRLRAACLAEDDPRQCAELLHRAGLLTTYQIDKIFAGRSHRLRVGPYRLLARLSGGASPVFKAEHLLLRRTVVLKVLGKLPRPEDTTPSAGWSHQEIEALGQLDHPNIVTAYDACRLGGRLVLVLQYIEGIDLQRLVEQTGPLPIELVFEILRQTTVALDYLHRQHLVHRDIKPGNLMLAQEDSRDNRPVVKVLDLGLACRAGTQLKEVSGTADYLAPECIADNAPVDIRSDLYALGCTGYFLLTGQVPYPGGNWTNKMLRHCLERPKPILQLRPEIPARLVSLIERLMARDPEHRYADPQAVLMDLDGPPEAEPSQPAPVVPVVRSGRLWRLVLAIVLLGALMGGTARILLPTAGVFAGPVLQSGVVILGRAVPFTDINDALDAAQDGDILQLGPGIHSLAPRTLRDKSLTLRAAPGTRPLLCRASNAPAWTPLLESNRDLTLESLDIHGGSRNEPPAPLLSVQEASLILRQCNVQQRGAAPALALRGGRQVLVEECQLQANDQALAIEANHPQQTTVRLQKTVIQIRDNHGVALLLWRGEPAFGRSSINVANCAIAAGSILSLRCLTDTVPLSIRDSRLLFHEALLRIDGSPDGQDSRLSLRWTGRDNQYQAQSAWLRLDGRPTGPTCERSWEQWWTFNRPDELDPETSLPSD